MKILLKNSKYRFREYEAPVGYADLLACNGFNVSRDSRKGFEHIILVDPRGVEKEFFTAAELFQLAETLGYAIELDYEDDLPTVTIKDF